MINIHNIEIVASFVDTDFTVHVVIFTVSEAELEEYRLNISSY